MSSKRQLEFDCAEIFTGFRTRMWDYYTAKAQAVSGLVKRWEKGRGGSRKNPPSKMKE